MICRIRRAQSLAEYVILLSIVAFAASMMFTMVKRGTQSLIKGGSDLIGAQKGAEQNVYADSGYMVYSRTRGQSGKDEAKTFYPGSGNTGGKIRRNFVETSNTDWKETYTNMGFTEY